MRILLADDDTDDCLFFKKVLDEIPVSTDLTTVRDGEQLMSYLCGNPKHFPDILFLDLNMPRKNGFECLCEIKENPVLKRLPVVMFSTSFPRDQEYEVDMISRLLSIGAISFIKKTSDFAKLKEEIISILMINSEENMPYAT